MNITTTLNNGSMMPLLGLGCWDMWGREAQVSVEAAINIGYRLIDTASMYGNEPEVGTGISHSGIAREEIFITTKVNNADQGFDETLRAYDESCKKLKLDYVDLYLIHWPLKRTRKQTWKALEKIYLDGRVKSIGVCNYLTPFLGEIDTYLDIVPAVNQCEFYPYLYDQKLLQACTSRGIVLQAWSPLLRGKRFADPKLIQIAAKYHKTPAQMLLRWALDHGISTIPKSSSVYRLKENFDVFDFTISSEDLHAMDQFDENYRMSGEDPMKLW